MHPPPVQAWLGMEAPSLGRARRLVPRLFPPCLATLGLGLRSLGPSFFRCGGVSFRCGGMACGRNMAPRGIAKRRRGEMMKGGRIVLTARNITPSASAGATRRMWRRRPSQSAGFGRIPACVGSGARMSSGADTLRLGDAGCAMRDVMAARKLTRDERVKVLCALLAHETFQARRQDQWPDAAIETMEALRGHMNAAVCRRQVALANATVRGSA